MDRHSGRTVIGALRNVVLLVLLLGGYTRAGAEAVSEDGYWREPFLVPDPGTHVAPIILAAVDAGDRFIVTGSNDKSVRVWSATDGRLLRTIRVPAGPGYIGMINAIALSPDGATIAAGGQTSKVGGGQPIYFFDRASGDMVGHIDGLPNVTFHLAWSPDGTRLLATLGGANGVRLYDVRDARAPRQVAADPDYGESSYWGVFDRAGRIATTSADGRIRLYGSALVPLAAVPAPGGKLVSDAPFSPDGTQLAVGYADTTRVDILDGHSLAHLTVPDTTGVNNGYLNIVAWSRDGTTLVAAGHWGIGGKFLVRSWSQAGRGNPADRAVSDNAISSLLPLADGRLLFTSQDPRIGIHDRDGRVMWEVGSPIADFRGQFDALKLGAGGRVVQFGFRPWGNNPVRFDLARRRLDADPAADPSLRPASRDPDVTDWQSLEPKRGGKRLALNAGEGSRSLASAPGKAGFVLGTDWHLRRFTADGELVWTVEVPVTPWAVNVTEDGRLIVAAYDDGTIRWHRWGDGAELLALFPHADRKRWVAWTPSGYYAASPGGEDMITWQINRGPDQAPEVYTASRFRDRFYRPDVVERVLDTLDVDKAVALANQEVGRRSATTKEIAEDTPPRVAIIDPAEDARADQSDITVAYSILDRPDTPIRRVRLMVDGRVAAEAKDLSVPGSGRLDGKLRVALQGEAPLLTLLAESARGSSDPASVRLRRGPGSDLHRPDLYVLDIGINRFRDPHLKTLNYAEFDAREIADRLRRQEGGLYSHVQVRLLTNEEATQQEILRGMEWLERAMTSRDVAVVFFATHGSNDARGDFFLIAHDTDMSDPIGLRWSGVSVFELRKTLATLADRGKTLVFLDTCYSGSVTAGARAGPADIDQVAADLAAAENGAIIFSAATGTQFSLEIDEKKHGAFTEALLEAFDGRSRAADPPWLYVSDFDIWLRDRVKELTHGAQTPVTTVPKERFTNPRVFRTVEGW